MWWDTIWMFWAARSCPKLSSLFAKSCVVRTLVTNSSTSLDLSYNKPCSTGSVLPLMKYCRGLKNNSVKLSGPIDNGLLSLSRRVNVGLTREWSKLNTKFMYISLCVSRLHYMYMQISYYHEKCEVICQWQKIHTHICSLGKKIISICWWKTSYLYFKTFTLEASFG